MTVFPNLSYAIGICLTAFLFVFAVCANAQGNKACSANIRANTEAIVVTAQRRTDNLQDVPLSVSVLDADALVRNDIRTLEDLSASVPGLVATNSVNYGAAPLSIRGIGGFNGGGNLFNDEPVAVYVNGVYVSRLSFSTADLVDVESIQVLRGPQVTLFGRNASAGALLINTQRPRDSFEATLRGGYDSLHSTRVEATVSGPVASDILVARAAFAYSDRRGSGSNLFNGDPAGGSENLTGRVSLRLRPDPTFFADIIVEYLDQRSKPATIQVAELTGGLDSPFVIRPDLKARLDRNEFAFNDPNIFRAKTFSATALAAWDTEWATFNLSFGYRNYESEGMQDADGTALTKTGADAVRFTNRGVFRYDQYSLELLLSSPDSNSLRWIVGSYYLHEKNAVDPFAINNFNGFFGLGTEASFRAFQTLDAGSIFGQVGLDITDRLAFTLGGRFSHETKEFQNSLSVLTLKGGLAPVPPDGFRPAGSLIVAPPTFKSSASFDDFSLQMVAEYKPRNNALVYASYSEGFKSGGFNVFGLTPAFEPESIEAYELGVKSQWADGRLRLNIAAFYYDYIDLQVRLPVPSGGVNIQNAAAASVKGIEVEGSAVIRPGLRIDGHIAFLDATFDEGFLPSVPSEARYRIGTPIPLTDEDISGNRLSRAPQWQARISGTYTFRLGNSHQVTAIATYRYQSNIFYLETNQSEETFRSGNWQEVGMRLELSSADSRWKFALFAENIFDDRHLTQITALNSFPNGAVNDPRKFGISGTANF